MAIWPLLLFASNTKLKVKTINNPFKKQKTNHTRKDFMKASWLLVILKELKYLKLKVWLENNWLREEMLWFITNLEEMLFQEVVIPALWVFVINGTSIMLIKTGKREYWIMYKKHSKQIVKLSIMTWFIPLAGWSSGDVQDHLVWEQNYHLISNT